MTELIVTKGANLLELISSRMEREEGQDMIEYALLAGLIAVFCIAAIVILGPQISDIFNTVSNALQGA